VREAASAGHEQLDAHCRAQAWRGFKAAPRNSSFVDQVSSAWATVRRINRWAQAASSRERHRFRKMTESPADRRHRLPRSMSTSVRPSNNPPGCSRSAERLLQRPRNPCSAPGSIWASCARRDGRARAVRRAIPDGQPLPKPSGDCAQIRRGQAGTVSRWRSAGFNLLRADAVAGRNSVPSSRGLPIAYAAVGAELLGATASTPPSDAVYYPLYTKLRRGWNCRCASIPAFPGAPDPR